MLHADAKSDMSTWRATMALRDSMRASAAEYLRPGETVQAVFGAQTASQLMAEVSGVFRLLGLNRYRIVVITPQRVLILDAGGDTMTTARGVVAELPRSTRLGPPSGLWHVIPAAGEKLRVHRRFFKDIETADTEQTAA
jgi:hypothetical protein